MFLKRSLVMMVGVLLFIGALFLKFHLSDAHLENVFAQERDKYGVADSVLTLPEASPPILPVAAAPSPPPIAPPSSDSSAADTDSTTPAPGNAPDTNTIIGPMPPSAEPETPAPATPAQDAVPAPDTNSGPMVPSTMNYSGGASFLVMTAYHPAGSVFQVVEERTAQETNVPATAATNSGPETTAPSGLAGTNAARPGTNVIVAVPAVTNGAPSSARVAISHAASAGGRAIVLGYHQFTGPGVPSKNIYSMSQDVFESEMKYLHDNGYRVVPLSDVVRFVKHEIGLPPNAVAITIDDGYKSALNYAWPVLKKYGYPWTYFVYPQFITKTEGKGAASWPDLLELDKEGVDVECHSMTHPQLSKKIQKFNGSRHLLSPQEYDAFLTSETFGAKALLEQNLGKKIKYFAYPYGDYNKQVEAKVVAAGFEAIFTVADNPVHITTDVHSIGRYIITKPVERNFAAYLRQGALSLAEVDPAPGATTSNPRPVITAVLGFSGDPTSLETDVRDFGVVRHDFDPQTSTVRLYLPRDLIQPDVMVSLRAKDAQSGQTMVANWHFNYEPSGIAPATHEPISSAPMTNATPAREASSDTAIAPKAPVQKETETNGIIAPSTSATPIAPAATAAPALRAATPP
jgi:peptidoglycan/xylan/chitin deacetylase (PgdA/CDA1 family)